MSIAGIRTDKLQGVGIFTKLHKSEKNGIHFYKLELAKLGASIEIQLTDEQYNELEMKKSLNQLTEDVMISYVCKVQCKNEARSGTTKEGKAWNMVSHSLSSPKLMSYEILEDEDF